SHAQPFHDLPQLERVAYAAGVLEGVLRSLGTRRRLAAEVVRLGREPPRSGEPEVVAARLEDRDRTLGDPQQVRRRDVRLGEEAQEGVLHERVRLEARIMRCG